ncbi:MAG: 4Fe-4S binding protein [Bacteroidales bacterium]|nr:4Fe-4S binding protein [Bacteroidales bacterium]
MLKKLRVVLALVFWVGITLLLLDFSGALHHWLGWMAKLQFLPAVLALNVGVVFFLILLTLVFGRVYCSVICPLGVLQDGISWLGTRKSKAPYKYKKELKWLRYGVWALFVIALIAGVQVFVALLAPYSAYGRMVQNLLQPLYLWGNNLFAYLAEKAGSYAFYPREVWIRSLPTFIAAAVMLVVIVVLSFKGGRTYCNTICPVGTTLSFLSRFAAFRPVIDADKCVRCKTCEIHCKAQCISITKEAVHIDYSRCVDCFNCIDTCPKGGLKYRFAWGKKKAGQAGSSVMPDSNQASGRRAFLTGTAIAVGSAALKGIEARAQEADKKVDGGFADVLPKQAPRRETPITPPGSMGARNFYRRCTGCQLCIAECPNNVLRPSSNLNRLMQPEMSFEKGYCRPECTRCSELCPAGAILPISKEVKTNFHLGTAGVDVTLCLEATGKSKCGKCAQACPTGAIMMVADGEHRRPVVAEEVCIGCGKCEYLCPVRPISAITVNGKEVHV